MSGPAYQPVTNPHGPPSPGAAHIPDHTLGTFDARYQQQNASTNSFRDGNADQDLYPPSRPWSGGSPEPRVQSFYEKMDDPSRSRPVWMNPSKPETKRRGVLRFLGNPCSIVIIILIVVGTAVGVPLGFYLNRHKNGANNANLPQGNSSQISAVIPPSIPGWRPMVDPDTPTDVYNKTALEDPNTPYDLIFSDEFNVDGRSFYPGDDPYWEAVDLHYWQTGNKEWYDPKAVTTKGGALVITLSQIPDAQKEFNHNLTFTGAMIQTWNQFCFTGGRIEVAVTLPGPNNVHGLWPAVWAMGNLGRAGFGGSLEGMWPYTYDACDRGTLLHQALPGEALRTAPGASTPLSNLPGQKLSRCTCKGEDHPGPKHDDGSFVGRSAPEIDIFEAAAGTVSQSGQWAPFNFEWKPLDPDTNFHIPNASVTSVNGYRGGPLQQAISSVSQTNKGCWEAGPGANGCFSVYGFEYKPGFSDSYITWMNDDVVAWRMDGAATAADTQAGIDARPVTNEPLYLIANLGISDAFGGIEMDKLSFPTTMKIDWIRVYQPRGQINYGCDPENFPTQDYINKYMDAYKNPNYTVWAPTDQPEQLAYGKPFPKNSLIDGCSAT